MRGIVQPLCIQLPNHMLKNATPFQYKDDLISRAAHFV